MSLNLLIPASGSYIVSQEIRDNVDHLYALDIQHASGSDPHTEYVLVDGIRAITGSQNILGSGSTFQTLTLTDALTVGNVGSIKQLHAGSGSHIDNLTLGNDGNYSLKAYGNAFVSSGMRVAGAVTPGWGKDSAASDATLNFCQTNSKTLKWDYTNQRFEFYDDLFTHGTISNNASGSTFNSATVVNDLQVGGTLKLSTAANAGVIVPDTYFTITLGDGNTYKIPCVAA